MISFICFVENKLRTCIAHNFAAGWITPLLIDLILNTLEQFI